MNKSNEISINGTIYVPKSEADNILAEKFKNLPYVMCRTYSAGVFMGYLKKKTGKEVELIKARRIWSWVGAASLSQLSIEGTSNPKECKFPCEVEKVCLTETIEIIYITEKAKIILNSVPIWKM
jgi:hypothetical protein